jgi:hypothetical protein
MEKWYNDGAYYILVVPVLMILTTIFFIADRSEKINDKLDSILIKNEITNNLSGPSKKSDKYRFTVLETKVDMMIHEMNKRLNEKKEIKK